MKQIEKDELYENLKAFLKTKGIELQEGTYAHRMQRSCGLLADAVNLSQQAFETARNRMDQTLDHMRQVIHERTAPKPAPKQAQAEPDRESRGGAKKKRAGAKAQAAKARPRRGAAGKKKTR